ncbi:arsenical pump-driving ATPase [Bacillus sp. FJAT-27264]|uniref:arsenical pump-driving ATPase n=1 Tax=Paenibacillus sp. (strain DSM 101736 / FJAT-27264) TaxID=1850362 RepID=UPI000807D0D1|nr:arsenical pump-driving ATPase [Bacillus sp. FJAT-27264]OBZ16307.1 arsenical pump-driving ATPase [Bacillus sp. FJAT-27264]
MIPSFDVSQIQVTPYLFFTGKGGVGKTSTACATAVALADQGKRVLLVSTDPASNLQDVFQTDLDMNYKSIPEVPNLFVTNLDPEEAASRYREDVVGPYRGKLPEVVINQMEEQLSGSCTVEIASFNEFSHLLTDQALTESFDHIIFDTAPTGHTLRLLQLPNAWNEFLHNSKEGTTQGGLLAGLDKRKEVYKQTVDVLSDPRQTSLVLVTRPDGAPLKEAARASRELAETGIKNQILIVNGLLMKPLAGDSTAVAYTKRQQDALAQQSTLLQSLPTYAVPLVSFNVAGVANVRRLFADEQDVPNPEMNTTELKASGLAAILDDIEAKGQRVIFTMGKGGVGKTTIANAIAVGLAARGLKVHLTTTDPATQLDQIMHDNIKGLLSMSKIDQKVEVEQYRQEVLDKARETMDEHSIAYAEEELNSPCTEEIAVFRAFADLVDRADNEIVVIDTAPSGHTLLLLDATESYHKEIANASGEVPPSVKKLLPRLRNEEETAVIIVTHAEVTPVFEAERLTADLRRAGIHPKWWLINQSMALTGTKDAILQQRAASERTWIQRVAEISGDHYVVLPWQSNEGNRGEQQHKMNTDGVSILPGSRTDEGCCGPKTSCC